MSYTPTEWESTDVVTATRMNALEQAVGDMNMSYTPNTWSDGDILSAEKMNALEQAVASGGGGGSGGDFSTATVTIVNNLQSQENLNMPCIMNAEGMDFIHPITSINSGTNTITVPLYKDGLTIIPLGAFQLLSAYSGDLTIIGEALLIFGNCSLTLG